MLRDLDTLRPFDDCPCGSGLSYGRCHGQLDAEEVQPESDIMGRLAQALRALTARRRSVR